MEEKTILTVRELAAVLRVSLPTAYQITERPGFPLIRIGRRKLVYRSALEAWLMEVGASGQHSM